MKKPKQVLLIIVTLGIVLPLSTLAIPLPDKTLSIDADALRAASISTTLFAWLHISAAWLFLLGLDGFKERLRKAYRAICIGLVVLGLAQLQFPVISIFDWWATAPVNDYGIISMPTAFATSLLFLGLRSFSKALNDKSWRVSLGVVPAAIAAGITAGIVLDVPYTAEAAGAVVAVSFGAVNAALALRIKQAAGTAYTNALAWLFLALVASAVSTLIPTSFDLLAIERGPILAVPSALAGILFVKAGYSFTKIKEY